MSKENIENQFNIEKTDVVVVFSEIDHRFISEELFKTIADLETDNFGSTLIKDPNPQNPFLQLTLPKSRVIVQVVGKRLIISDNSGVLPKESDLLKRYFQSVYYPLVNTVPCEPIAFGFNYGFVVQRDTDKLDKSLGITALSSKLSKEIDGYSTSFGFRDESTKYNVIVNTLGKTRKLQLNAHLDTPELLNDNEKMRQHYESNWEYLKKFYEDLI